MRVTAKPRPRVLTTGLVALLALWSSGLPVPTAQASPTSPGQRQTSARLPVTIDVSRTYQRIDGFGASTRVWADPHVWNSPAPSMSSAAQTQVLDLLIRDLGITRLRPIIDPGIEVANDNTDATVTTGTGFDFSGKRTDGQVALVRQAVTRGLRVYFPAPLSPEPWMSERNPDEYVEWILAQLLRWKQLGAEPEYLSPINEPSYARAGGWPVEWYVQVVRRLGPRMREAGLRTRLVIPDEISPRAGLDRAEAVLRDPVARKYVGALAYHLYGGDADAQLEFARLGNRYDLPVWMTEFSQAGYNTWPEVLEWARLVDGLLSTANVSAIDYLWGFSGSHEAGHTLVSLSERDGQYQGFDRTAAYWVTGQYSRFVRPGYKRVDVSARHGHVSVTAFTSKRDDRLVIVAINDDPAPQSLGFNVRRGRVDGDVRVVRSSRTEEWRELKPLVAGRQGFETTLGPSSVTTFIGRLEDVANK